MFKDESVRHSYIIFVRFISLYIIENPYDNLKRKTKIYLNFVWTNNSLWGTAFTLLTHIWLRLYGRLVKTLNFLYFRCCWQFQLNFAYQIFPYKVFQLVIIARKYCKWPNVISKYVSNKLNKTIKRHLYATLTFTSLRIIFNWLFFYCHQLHRIRQKTFWNKSVVSVRFYHIWCKMHITAPVKLSNNLIYVDEYYAKILRRRTEH